MQVKNFGIENALRRFQQFYCEDIRVTAKKYTSHGTDRHRPAKCRLFSLFRCFLLWFHKSDSPMNDTRLSQHHRRQVNI